MTPHKTSTGQMRRVMTAQLDALEVPDGVLRTAVNALLDVVDTPGRPGDLPIALRALDLMQVEIRSLYSPPRTTKDEKQCQ